MSAKKYPLFLWVLLYATLQLPAQSKSFKGVLEIELKNFGPIYEQNQVKGYFMFYEVDKVSKEKNKYLLRILDQNLNEILKKEMVEDVKFYLLEAVYTEAMVMLKFFNDRKNTIHLLGMDKQGEMVVHQSMPGRHDSYVKEYPYTYLISRNKTLFTIENKGFLDYSLTTNEGGNIAYAIHFTPTTPDLTNWDYTSPNEDIEVAEFLGIMDETIFSAIYKKKGEWALNTYIAAHNFKTGELIFERVISTENLGIKPLMFKMTPTAKDITFVGHYYPKKKVKFLLAPSKPADDRGLLFAKINADGTLTDENYLSLKKEMELLQLMPKKKNGKPYEACFHNIIQQPNGESYLVWESMANLNTFSKRIKDMVLIHVNDAFEPTEMHLFVKKEKQPYKEGSLPYQSNLGNWSQNFEFKDLGFDYSFTAKAENQNDFVIGYLANESRRNKTQTNPYWVFGAIIYQNGTFSSDRIGLKSKADEVFALPAKFGYVAVLEYFEDEKQIDVNLKRLNF